MTLQEETLASHIVEFCRFCRASGLSAGVKESVDALDAARTVGVSDREILKSALRSVLCSTRDEWEQFDELFAAFWSSEQPGSTVTQRRARSDERLPQGASRTLMGGAKTR